MVPGSLYLDTARLGRMSAGARRVVRDFVGLAGEVGLPLYCEEFLHSGFPALPWSLQGRYPALACWSGISGLKNAFRRVVGGTHDVPVFLANRSTQLMEAAVKILLSRCRSVLTTDMDWPAYRNLLDKERRLTDTTLHAVAIRDSIQGDQMSADDVTHRIAAEFLRRNCDGLYLTAMSHDGVRLNGLAIVQQIERVRRIKMVVVDGAQHFCHGPSPLNADWCDVYVAGCHKWLRAYQPTGVMFLARRMSQEAIVSAVTGLLDEGEIDDPLLRFTQQIEGDCLDGHTETVNLMPLFSSAGALDEALSCIERNSDQFRRQLLNAELVIDLARAASWQPQHPSQDFRSGIVVLEASGEATARLTPHQLRTVFHELGISLSAYEKGRIRLSMPKWPLAACDVNRLRKSLERVA